MIPANPCRLCAEQDEQLDELAQTVSSTHHIALAVNDELDLHTQLLVRSSRQPATQRAEINCNHACATLWLSHACTV